MGNLHFIGRNVRTKIFREYLDDHDRFFLMTSLGTVRNGIDVDQTFINVIAGRGYLDLLKWLEMTYCYVLKMRDEAAIIAAANGHINVLEHCWISYSWSGYRSTLAAIKNGHLDVLKWLENTKIVNWTTGFSATYTETATLNNRFEILQWLRARKCPVSRGTFQNAIISGNLEMIKWMYEQSLFYDGCTMASAAITERLDILQWAHSVDLLNDVEECLDCARKCGHMEIVFWLESL